MKLHTKVILLSSLIILGMMTKSAFVFASDLTANNIKFTKNSSSISVSGSIKNTSSTKKDITINAYYGTSATSITNLLGVVYTGSLEPGANGVISNKAFNISVPSGKIYGKISERSDFGTTLFSGEVFSGNGDSDGKDGGNGKSSGADSNGDSDGKDGGNGKSSGVHQSTTLENPLKVDSLWGFVELVLGWVVRIGSVVVGLFLLIAGFNFVTAQGNEEKLAAAKRGLLYTIIGAILLLGAWTIATVISNTIEQIAK